MNVHIMCRNYNDDRVIPRFARHLAERLGWSIGKQPNPNADINYLLAYFEAQLLGNFRETPLVSYMTHLEEGENAKTKLYNDVAKMVDLRIAMNAGQLKHLNKFGETVQIPLPLERDKFELTDRHHNTLTAGFSGYTYRSGRKGASMAGELVKAFPRVQWKASGRGWPCEVKKYKWTDMQKHYHALDIFVNTSLVEGGPMTTLEALATGCPVVIPDTVGLHPELPDDLAGIFKYKRGDAQDLKRAFAVALEYVQAGNVDRQALRAATLPHSVERWCDGNRVALESLLYNYEDNTKAPPLEKGKNYGIYMVAFGEPSRNCAQRAIETIHNAIPGVPVALCTDRELGPEDITIIKNDFDIGGRTAKLKVYDFAPKEWDYVLYLDADIEVHADVSFYFELVRDGWDYVICKDAHQHDTMTHFQRRNNTREFDETINELGTNEALQINGGAWAFRRNDKVKRFFERWYAEWAKYKGRDQGALIRAMYIEPLRVYWLGNEWNTLVTLKGHEYPPGVEGSAGVLHFVGRARRWKGQVPAGKGLTDPEAWAMVERFMQRYKQQ